MPFVLDKVAAAAAPSIGLDTDSVAFLIMLPTQMILSGGLRWISDPTTRYLYSLITGVIVAVEMYGEHTFVLPLSMVLGAYLIMVLTPRVHCNKIVIAYIAIHFSAQSIWKIVNNYEQNRDFVIPSMIIVQKLWRFSCIYRDGDPSIKDETLNSYQVAHKLKQMPSLLEFFSYCFSIQSALFGPNFCFTAYKDFIEF